ncbi:hypothetical protein FGIG_09554 [Fasciola gigantica]|uniref:BPTI/Kunitz inhibitor domain-containing protein n=1 Tax=Fasciola gigantica TaxID=46835 RepID=A0A504YIJ2_FASGI|nr:hypothetical protein FGIG_09554 [Fasciola gigantica]
MDPDKDTLLSYPSDDERGYASARSASRLLRRRRMRRGWVACLVLIGFGVFLLMLLGASYMARIYLPNINESMHPDCTKKLDPGNGEQSLVRWGWDSIQGRCMQFTYKGQDGNANRFRDAASCDQKCPRRVLV